MSAQTVSQIILFTGIILTALGGYGSYHYGKEEERERERISDEKQRELKTQVSELQTRLEAVQENTSETHKTVNLIYQATKITEEEWTEVELKNVPPGVTDYILLLFASDKGRVSGKVRIKGSDEVYSFSTTANNKIPLALRNLWLPDKGQYKVPTIMEFAVTEKTEDDASLSVYTQGWIDTRGREPH